MRKFFVIILTLVLILSTISCNNGSKNESSLNEQVTLKYWSHVDEDAWIASEDKMIAAFEKENPNIKIVRESFPYDEFEQKVQTSLISKSGGADIYEMWGGWAIDFASTGCFSPVPDELISDLKNDCYAPVLGAMLYDGKYYGVPLEFNAEYGGMLILKPYFDEHNIAYPTTWDDMIKIATDNSKSNGEVFDMRGFDFISFDTLPYTWLSMILSSGGSYLQGDKGDKVNFDTPIAKETLQKLVDYVKVNKVTDIASLTGEQLENQDWLFMGEALMAPRGMWSITTGIGDYELEYGKDFDYIQTPFYGSQKLWAAETGWSMAVNSSSEYTEQAWKFIEFCLRPENLLQINIDCGMIPPRKSVAHDPEYVKAVPYAAPILDVLDGASFVGYFNTDTLKESICNMFVDIIQNGTSIDEAISGLNDAINSK